MEMTKFSLRAFPQTIVLPAVSLRVYPNTTVAVVRCSRATKLGLRAAEPLGSRRLRSFSCGTVSAKTLRRSLALVNKSLYSLGAPRENLMRPMGFSTGTHRPWPFLAGGRIRWKDQRVGTTVVHASLPIFAHHPCSADYERRNNDFPLRRFAPSRPQSRFSPFHDPPHCSPSLFIPPSRLSHPCHHAPTHQSTNGLRLNAPPYLGYAKPPPITRGTSLIARISWPSPDGSFPRRNVSLGIPVWVVGRVCRLDQCL